MEKIKKCIANLKVEGKLKVYQMTVLVMTLFLVLVALISTLVIRSNKYREDQDVYKRQDYNIIDYVFWIWMRLSNFF